MTVCARTPELLATRSSVTVQFAHAAVARVYAGSEVEALHLCHSIRSPSPGLKDISGQPLQAVVVKHGLAHLAAGRTQVRFERPLLLYSGSHRSRPGANGVGCVRPRVGR